MRAAALGPPVAMLAAMLAPVLAAAPLPSAAEAQVQVSPGSPPFPGVQGLPRLAAGAPAAIRARINAALAQADARGGAAAATCTEEARGRGISSGAGSPAWERTVRVTQAGPRLLSFLVSDESYCGGPHPNAEVFPLVYDLQTGRPADWMRLLPPGLASAAEVSTAGDGTTLGLVRSPALLRIAIGDAAPDCVDPLAHADWFTLWPEAGGLTATVFGLPHAVAACATPVTLTPGQLRARGGAGLARLLAPAARR